MYAVKTPSKYMTAKTRRGALILLFNRSRRLHIYNASHELHTRKIIFVYIFVPGICHSFDRLDSFRENFKKVNGAEEEELPSYVPIT